MRDLREFGSREEQAWGGAKFSVRRYRAPSGRVYELKRCEHAGKWRYRAYGPLGRCGKPILYVAGARTWGEGWTWDQWTEGAFADAVAAKETLLRGRLKETQTQLFP